MRPRTLCSSACFTIYFLFFFLLSSTSFAKGEELTMLLIDKKNHNATLQTLPTPEKGEKVIKNFKIATGKSRGDKEIEGDNKTPEGVYFTQPHIPGRKLWAQKYGPMAIPLDFSKFGRSKR